MPEIARFHGIVITMYHREHGTAHFHAAYAGQRVSVDIVTGAIRGSMDPMAEKRVLEWLGLHKRELLDNWELSRKRAPLKRIAPLE